jgi:hypothetical protein
MKLFISYSRDDKDWTYKLWKKLRDDTSHNVWIDQRIAPASDWWRSILEEIEKCECFLFIMSPKSVESIYCLAELHYAFSLNKPILPVMLKTCIIPDILKENRIQFQNVISDRSLDKILNKLWDGLNYVAVALSNGEYVLQTVSRPPEPKPTFDSTETMQMAEEAASHENYSLAERLFQQVIEADKGVLADVSKERLEDILNQQERNIEYRKIHTLASNSSTIKTAQRAWQYFTVKYGNDYDPENLTKLIGVSGAPNASVVTGHQFAYRPAIVNSKDKNPLDGFFAGMAASKQQNRVKISLDTAYLGGTQKIDVNKKEIELKIPKAVIEGTRIKLSKEKTGWPQDIIVTVDIEPHKLFVRDEDDLYTRIKLDEKSIEHGGKVNVETFSGTVQLTVPPHSLGKKFRLNGKRMPKKSNENEFGDLYVELYSYNTLPFAVNVESLGGVATPLLMRDSNLPTTKNQVFSTAADNQTQVEIHLCYGDKPMAADNLTLGKFILDAIEPASRGVPQIDVIVTVDSNQILTVKAVNKANGKTQSFREVDLKNYNPPQ